MKKHVVDALVKYVQLFDGRVPLRQKHYLAHCTGHGWPSIKAINYHGKFQAVIAEARAQLRAEEGER